MPTALQLSTIVWKARDYSVDPSSRSEAYGTSIQCAAIIASRDGMQSTNSFGRTRKRAKYGRGAEAITPSDGETLYMSTYVYRTGNILYRIAYRTLHIGITDANSKWMAAVATNSRIIKYPLSCESPGLRGHHLEVYQA